MPATRITNETNWSREQFSNGIRMSRLRGQMLLGIICLDRERCPDGRWRSFPGPLNPTLQAHTTLVAAFVAAFIEHWADKGCDKGGDEGASLLPSPARDWFALSHTLSMGDPQSN